MTTGLDQETRDKLLADPGVILADRDLMRALVVAREAELGDNVVDIRGRAMEALEARLNRLEALNESVISAAYDNQSGTAIVHRAVIGLLESSDLGEFLSNLQNEIAPLMRIDSLVLVIESDPDIPGLADGASMVSPGEIDVLVSAGRRAPRGSDILLRPAAEVTRQYHGTTVSSEALVPLDLGPSYPQALLLMGSTDSARFMPTHGTDLLRFFAQAFRLVLIARLRNE